MIIEKQDLMLPQQNHNKITPILKKSHFLKPVLDQNSTIPKPPCLNQCAKYSMSLLKTKVSFNCRTLPLKNWTSWIDTLIQTHQQTWKHVGIFDAIMGTTYKLKSHSELIFCLAEKWCPETNTFVFPFGEASVTLEDVVVLGGYPVLGECVRTRVSDSVKEKLLSFFDNVANESGTNVLHCEWIEVFTGFGGEIEHVAFLVLWLCRYVFPSDCYGYVSLDVVGVAMSLARGTRIALAPAVLASIYRDLGLLKARIVEFVSGGDDGSKLVLCAPFVLVQLWVWERFTLLGTEPVSGLGGEPRLARWVNTRKTKPWLVRFEFESTGECFIWKPYGLYVTNREFSEVYSDDERIVSINSETSEELLSFARCLRGCELVGLDSIEQYLPHRVGMQFGLDQDIPCCVSRSNQSLEVAWSSYNEPLDGVVLYLPPRLYKGEVTARYFDWWGTESDQYNTRKTRRRSKRITRKRYEGGDDNRVIVCLSSSDKSVSRIEDTGTTETSPPCDQNPCPSDSFVAGCGDILSQIMAEVSPLPSQYLAKSDPVNPTHGIVVESAPTSPCKFRAQNAGAIDSESSDTSQNLNKVQVCSEVTPSRANLSANVDEMYVDTNHSPCFKSTPDVNICVASTSIHHVDITNVEPRPSCDKNPPHSSDYNKGFESIEISLPCDDTLLPSSNFTESENAQTKSDHVDPAHDMIIESTPTSSCIFHVVNVGVNASEIVSPPNSLRTEDIPPLRNEKADVCKDVKKVTLEVSPNVDCLRLTDRNEESPCSAASFCTSVDEMCVDAGKSVLDCENLSQNIHKDGHDKTNTKSLRFQFIPNVFTGSTSIHRVEEMNIEHRPSYNNNSENVNSCFVGKGKAEVPPLHSESDNVITAENVNDHVPETVSSQLRSKIEEIMRSIRSVHVSSLVTVVPGNGVNGSQNVPLITIDEEDDDDNEDSDLVKAIKRSMSDFDDRICKLEAMFSEIKSSDMV